MRFGILGETRAWHGDDEVPLGGPARRALLALLLVRPRGGRLDRPAGRGDRPRRDTVRAFDSVGQVHMDAWSRGRVALIGDAAHCPSSLSGMGSGLALVGACVLAGELAAAHGDHRVASGRYEQEMREYAEGCQDRPQGRREHHAPRLPRTRPVTAPGRHRHHTGSGGAT